MKVFLFIIIQIISTIAIAGGGGGHHDAGLPFGMLVSQAINFSLLAAIIYIFAGKAIGDFFRSKKEDFLASVESASKAVAEATQRKDEITAQYNKLKKNHDSDLQEATQKAEEMYRIQVTDARNQAVKMTEDTDKALDGELQKAIEHLRVETFSKSAEMAEKNLESNLTPDKQKAWNNTFPNRLKGGVH